MRRTPLLLLLALAACAASPVSLLEPGGETAVSGLASVLPDPLTELLMARAEPKLMIEYERAYYEAVDSPLQITLDRDFTFWRQDGSRFPSRRFAVRVPGLTVLEGKAPIGQEEGIR